MNNNECIQFCIKLVAESAWWEKKSQTSIVKSLREKNNCPLWKLWLWLIKKICVHMAKQSEKVVFKDDEFKSSVRLKARSNVQAVVQ